MASQAPYYQALVATRSDVDHNDSDFPENTMPSAYHEQPSTYPEPLPHPSEYPYQHHSASEPTDHAQLHDLVEAATSAAAQEQLRQTFQHDGTQYYSSDVHPEPNHGATRKRKSSASGGHARDLDNEAREGGGSKRQKRTSTRASRQRPGLDGQEALERSSNYPSDSTHLVDARAVGVHSAAALFRPPSDLSAKYTRPPMSKLYTSLQLSPENFLKLQSAAKAYMLDDAHPDRRACVGNRAQTDGQGVKLKLVDCTEAFLEEEGHGEMFFGIHAPPPGKGEQGTPGQQRGFVWPTDKIEVIALCTPLLRRMVTNERQRQYAIDARKGGKAKGTESLENEGDDTDAQTLQKPELMYGGRVQIYLLDANSREALRDTIELPLGNAVHWGYITDVIERQASTALGVRCEDEILLGNSLRVQLLASQGLVTVSSNEEWMLLTQDALQTVWLDRTVKVIVHCTRPALQLDNLRGV